MYRAAAYINEGNGVRLPVYLGPVTDDLESAMGHAETMAQEGRDKCGNGYWACVVSRKSYPHAFPD